MLSPRFQAAPVILLATFLAWKHPSCFLTTFIFTKKAQPAHYIHVRQTLLFSSLTSWNILFKQNPINMVTSRNKNRIHNKESQIESIKIHLTQTRNFFFQSHQDNAIAHKMSKKLNWLQIKWKTLCLQPHLASPKGFLFQIVFSRSSTIKGASSFSIL